MFSVGGLTKTCPFCKAKRFQKESTSGCCLNGKVRLPPKRRLPQSLISLFQDGTFLKDVRKYNQGLAWTSLGASVDLNLANQTGGTYCFKIHGQLHHNIGCLLPEFAAPPKFAQIYFMESQKQANRRTDIYEELDRNNYMELSNILKECHNPFVEVFRNARDTIGIYLSNSKKVKIFQSKSFNHCHWISEDTILQWYQK